MHSHMNVECSYFLLVSTNKCTVVGDMPPELIVTSAQAQMTDVDTNEKVQEKQAESDVTREPEHQQTEKIRRRKSRQMPAGYVVCVPIHEPYTVRPMKIKEGDNVIKGMIQFTLSPCVL